MSRKTGQKSLATLITHASMIALIAMVMPIGADISNNGDAWFGAPFSHPAPGGCPQFTGAVRNGVGSRVWRKRGTGWS